jgi:hypothetical protein
MLIMLIKNKKQDISKNDNPLSPVRRFCQEKGVGWDQKAAVSYHHSCSEGLALESTNKKYFS